MNLANEFLQSAIQRVTGYKQLADKTFEQLNDADMHYQPNEESNSIAVIIQHLSGNMLSRWTDLLTSDGEKDWRNRDAEFENRPATKKELLELWEKGWDRFLAALNNLNEDNLLQTIHIRHEPLLIIDAINRQLAHYPYHVGQIVYIGRIIKNREWKNLSIPKNASSAYNDSMKNKLQ